MKKILLAALLLLGFGSYAQDTAAPINRLWHQYASDTTRTYTQITHLCDSLFAQAGYGVLHDSLSDSTFPLLLPATPLPSSSLVSHPATFRA